MDDNSELARRLDLIIAALEGIEGTLTQLRDRQADEQDRIELAQARTRELQARADDSGWPWTPETATQGFLAARWLRRDGTSYGGAALRGASGPNSPIRGGDDNQAKVSVLSGDPRVK